MKIQNPFFPPCVYLDNVTFKFRTLAFYMLIVAVGQ